MTMDHVAAKVGIEADERLLARLPLDADTLHELGGNLLARAPAPLSAKIVLGRRTVLMLAKDGTGLDNERFLDLKINTVFNCGHSSLWWFHHLRATGRRLADVAWADPKAVIDMGGGVPLFAGTQLVGALAVSGLPHEDDHALIMEAVRRMIES
ncbi:MAG: heme-binding protein [Chelatococcus sp.]|jgi:uncharacterized protein (UPF0303 family)|uniref:heme-binding protein n=1 Tax=unclassified Chelatococcus TaxID=2638111 RepID=UPI001BD028E1|nr:MULTISPECIES: heme-binding protein [unclassified Chelatococcus]CAH1651720.1 conserved hypothetical protein [Hyphomicrobiales bacterium]MBS7743130.1 heme-binding protein [Chelatococcus sp. HY11]MBX3537931.1 heme-binding protein [Chelatococcus sp.]MBX3541752.1 heme-binding protein [Chelatococcus sp.]MCO5074356.1 heme-binding protein [Chelatococcus sp.]